ncbi:MAG: hypothetical protein K6F30_00510 [Lachnospiraceae bacterium]|nr:hypothetical protein [Lachnospiraceae bacterium]
MSARRKRIISVLVICALFIVATFYVINETRIRIACVGDSITFGAGVYETRKTESYPAYLQDELGYEYRVLNLGKSGSTGQKNGIYGYHLTSEYKKSLNRNNDIYIVMLGSNDAKKAFWNKEAYVSAMDELVDLYIDIAGAENVYLVKPPKCYPNPKDNKILYEISDDVVRDEIGTIIETMAEEKGTKCIDLYALTDGHAEYYDDGIHPNAYGNKVIAEYIGGIIQENNNK